MQRTRRERASQPQASSTSLRNRRYERPLARREAFKDFSTTYWLHRTGLMNDHSKEQFVYLTTTGRKTGLAREIEIWFVNVTAISTFLRARAQSAVGSQRFSQILP